MSTEAGSADPQEQSVAELVEAVVHPARPLVQPHPRPGAGAPQQHRVEHQVTRVGGGGRDEDARSIGFDEGPKMSDWPSALRERGISVERDVLREEAASVLRGYAESGGLIYNARRR